jgi:hypothetical protein
MKRTIMLLTAAALMAAMLVATAAPALARVEKAGAKAGAAPLERQERK